MNGWHYRCRSLSVCSEAATAEDSQRRQQHRFFLTLRITRSLPFLIDTFIICTFSGKTRKSHPI
jgi:hypothetical protein